MLKFSELDFGSLKMAACASHSSGGFIGSGFVKTQMLRAMTAVGTGSEKRITTSSTGKMRGLTLSSRRVLHEWRVSCSFFFSFFCASI